MTNLNKVIPVATSDEITLAWWEMVVACRAELSQHLAYLASADAMQAALSTAITAGEELLIDPYNAVAIGAHNFAKALYKIGRLWEAYQYMMDVNPDDPNSVYVAETLWRLATSLPEGSTDFVTSMFEPTFTPSDPAWNYPEYQRWLALRQGSITIQLTTVSNDSEVNR